MSASCRLLGLEALAAHTSASTMQRSVARAVISNTLRPMQRMPAAAVATRRVWPTDPVLFRAAPPMPRMPQPMANLRVRSFSNMAAQTHGSSINFFGLAPGHMQQRIYPHFLRNSHQHASASHCPHRRLFSVSASLAVRQAALGRIDLTPPKENEMDDEGKFYDPRLRSEVRLH